MTASARFGLWLLLAAWPGQPVDDGVRAWVQAHRVPVLEAPMRLVSDKSRVVLIAGGALALFAGSAGRAFALESAIALVPVNVAAEGLKWCVGRTRPDGDTNRRNSSLPSSHAANAFAIAMVLARRFRRAAIPAWLAAGIVAYSRLYLDRHWFSDVVCALALGVASGLLAAWLLRRWRRTSEATVAA